MESKCPICSIPGSPFLQANDYNRRISEKVFSYHRCPSCGLIYLVNVPEDLGKYYPASYYAIPKDRESLLENSAQEQYKLEIVQQFINKGRLLEIGPAWGTFACLAKQSGFDVDVIEMDTKCCDFIQNKLGIKAIQSNNIVATLEGFSGYDVITLWQVVEHLSDPCETLKTAAEKLLPGGILVVSTPNPEAFQFKIMGARWPHVDAPRHLNLIPKEVLVDFLKRYDLELIMETTDDQGGRSWNKFGWQRRLMNCFSGKWMQRVSFVLGYCLSFPMSLWDRIESKGCAYTVIFQKKVIR